MNKITIGNCTLIHGDSHLVLKTLDTDSINSYISDPPYLYLNHKLDRPFNHELIFNEIDRLLINNSLIAFFGRGFAFSEWIIYFYSLKYTFKESVVWNKNRNSTVFNALIRVHEDIAILSKGTCKINKIKNNYVDERLTNNDFIKIKNDINRIKIALNCKKKLSEILDYLINSIVYYVNTSKHGLIGAAGNSNEAIGALKSLTTGLIQTSIITVAREHYQMEHGTQKPVELMSRLIRLCTQENDTILDCFMGGGSTLVAAINTNRKAIGIEIDKDYFDIAVKRVREAYNNKQHLLDI